MKLKKYNLSFLKTPVFLVQALLLMSVFVFSAETVNALTQFKPQVTIPGSTQFEEGKSFPVSGTAIAEFIKAWYEFAIAAIGILATVMIMAGGLIWLTAGGNASQVSKAKDWITGAVIGVFLALGSYTLLELLNPDLVTLKSIEIKKIEVNSVGCKCGDYAKDEVGCNKCMNCIAQKMLSVGGDEMVACEEVECKPNGKACDIGYTCKDFGEKNINSNNFIRYKCTQSAICCNPVTGDYEQEKSNGGCGFSNKKLCEKGQQCVKNTDKIAGVIGDNYICK